MTRNKHIAMWTCARSRSTLVTRAFQQLDGCIVFDEPFYAPYLFTHKVDHPHRLEIIGRYETNYEKVIQTITGDLPQGASFSFQKHTANNIPKHMELHWLTSLTNFFLIRHPNEMIYSRQEIYNYPKTFTLHEIGIKEMYDLFILLQKVTEEIPIVVDSTDLVKAPYKVLEALCNKLGLDFSNKMLTWESGMRKTDPVWAKTWYKTILNSNGFIPFSKQKFTLPNHLKPIVKECLPFYEKLYEFRMVV